MRFNLFSSLFLVLAVGMLGFELRHGPWTPVRTAGAVLTLGSLALLLAARLQLGSAFSVRAKATTRVTTGRYRRLRNPIYTLGCVLVVGVAMFLRLWPLLLLLAVLIPMQVVRSRREAAVLEAAFGEQYRAYRRQTWF
jgi:protein-S-isoprenylcysteine O-methyltransferase Ste14